MFFLQSVLAQFVSWLMIAKAIICFSNYASWLNVSLAMGDKKRKYKSLLLANLLYERSSLSLKSLMQNATDALLLSLDTFSKSWREKCIIFLSRHFWWRKIRWHNNKSIVKELKATVFKVSQSQVLSQLSAFQSQHSGHCYVSAQQGLRRKRLGSHSVTGKKLLCIYICRLHRHYLLRLKV